MPAAVFGCKRAGLVAGFSLLDAGSRKNSTRLEEDTINRELPTEVKKLGLPIWRECARSMRKWYPDHKRFFAVSCCAAVSKNFLHNFYFWSKHHARPMSYRLVLSGMTVHSFWFIVRRQERRYLDAD